MSKPSSPAAYQPNNRTHLIQLHFPNHTRVPPTEMQAPPARRSPKPSPDGSFLAVSSKQPPPSSVRTQDQNPGLPHPNQPPTTQIGAPSHVVPENRAPATRFRVLVQNPPPSRAALSQPPHQLNLALPHPNQLPTTRI